MRQVHAVFLVIFAGLLLAGCGWYTLPGEEDPYKASQTDIEILLVAKDLLADENNWTRHNEQQCDMNASQWTLFCALQKASRDVTGEFKLRRAALEEARIATEEVAGKDLQRRLLDFNNMETITFEDVHRVLDLALEKVRQSINNS